MQPIAVPGDWKPKHGVDAVVNPGIVPIVWPEQVACVSECGVLEERTWVHQGHIVRIQQQYFAEAGGIHQSEGFQGKALQVGGAVVLRVGHLLGVDAPHSLEALLQYASRM